MGEGGHWSMKLLLVGLLVGSKRRIRLLEPVADFMMAQRPTTASCRRN